MRTDFIKPATSYPFMVGAVVYEMPRFSGIPQTLPPPKNRVVVLSTIDEWGYVDLQRENGSHRRVRSDMLVLAAHCPDCHTGAVKISHSRLICPNCDGPVVDQPFPDHLVWRRIPPVSWRTWIILYHSSLDPSKSYKELGNAYTETLIQAQQQMRQRLGLEKAAYHDSPENSQLASLLRFYALIEDEPGYLSTYYQLVQQPVLFVPLAA